MHSILSESLFSFYSSSFSFIFCVFLFFYLFFFSDVVMESHGGDETKTISYMSKFLKYVPERAGEGGRKEK